MNIYEQKEVKALEDEIDQLFDKLKRSIYDVTVSRRNWLAKVKNWLGFVGKSPVYRQQYPESKIGLSLHQYAEIKGIIGGLEGRLNELSTFDQTDEYIDDILSSYRDKLKGIVRKHADAISRGAPTPTPTPPTPPERSIVRKRADAAVSAPTAPAAEEPGVLGLRHPRYFQLKKARNSIQNNKNISSEEKRIRYNFIDKELAKYEKEFVPVTGEIPEDIPKDQPRKPKPVKWKKGFKGKKGRPWPEEPSSFRFTEPEEEEEGPIPFQDEPEDESVPFEPEPIATAARPLGKATEPKKAKKAEIAPMSEDEIEKAIEDLDNLGIASLKRLQLSMGISGGRSKEEKRKTIRAARGVTPEAEPEAVDEPESPAFTGLDVEKEIADQYAQHIGTPEISEEDYDAIIKLGYTTHELRKAMKETPGLLHPEFAEHIIKQMKDRGDDLDVSGLDDDERTMYHQMGKKILSITGGATESIQNQVDKYKKLLREEHRPELLQKQVAKLSTSERVNFYREKLASFRDRS